MTRELLMKNFPEELGGEGAIQLCIMKTQGDMILDKARRQRSCAFTNNSSHLNACRR